jgi:hypothetical protein
MFRYPVSVWADDAALSVPELEACIEELVRVGLIEFDTEEQVVRIVAWFHKKNCPENASRMISLVREYQSIENDSPAMLLSSVSEFVVGAVRRAQSWDSTSPDWDKLRASFKEFMRQTYQDYGNDFLEALAAEVLAAGKAVRAEICSLFPLCEETLVAAEGAPCPHPEDTLPPHVHDMDMTRHGDEHEKKHEEEINTAQFPSEVEQSQTQGEKGNVEVLRKGGDQTGRGSQSRPLDGTKLSRLAQEALGARGGR